MIRKKKRPPLTQYQKWCSRQWDYILLFIAYVFAKTLEVIVNVPMLVIWAVSATISWSCDKIADFTDNIGNWIEDHTVDFKLRKKLYWLTQCRLWLERKEWSLKYHTAPHAEKYWSHVPKRYAEKVKQLNKNQNAEDTIS